MIVTWIVGLLAAATLAFASVYSWAYLPLFAATTAIGLVGLKEGLSRELRPLALALGILTTTIAVQLVPIPRAMLEMASPATADLLRGYSVSFPSAEFVPLSIDPGRTRIALAATASLAVYVLGAPALLARSLRLLPQRLLLFAVPFALFGIYAREQQNGLIYWFWQPFEAVDGKASNQFGPFVNRNHFGGWMLMTLCLVTGWLLGLIEKVSSDRRAHGRRLAWLSSAEANVIMMTAAAIVVCAVALFWTLSRSAILAFGAAVTMFVWLASTRRRLSASGRRAVLVALAAALLVGTAWRGPARLVAWFSDNNLPSRLDAWRDGWDVVTHFPLFGTGVNTFPVAMLFYQTRNRDVYMSQAHNDYVQILAEGGLLVAVPAAIAIAVLALAIRRNLAAAQIETRGYWVRAGAAVGLCAIAIQEFLEFSLQIPVNAMLFATLAAIALAPVRQQRGHSAAGSC